MGDEKNVPYGRSMEETPTWAVGTVCFVLIVISILIERALHLVGKWFKKNHKRALFEAFEKIKSELMLLGFISLMLTVLQDHISGICVSKSVGNTWLPCESGRKRKEGKYTDKCMLEGKVAFMSKGALHQLHIFIFVLAVFHVLYCITTLALGRIKMKKWKKWEDGTRSIEYQYSNDPERFRFARNTTFGRRHLQFWSHSNILLWIVCFFRQFVSSSVAKVDYLTLRNGFITAHLAPGSETRFDFQKYINRSLDEDFKVVVEISPVIWFSAVLFLLSNTDGLFSYLWLPFVPLIIILVVGAKLQMIITKMGVRIQERGEVLRGPPVVQPDDDLFWFGRPRFILFLIHFVLFQNAFQLAFFAWSSIEFKFKSCFHERPEAIAIRISMGVIIQVICSYVTLPLYALVTQMGSNMRLTIFTDRVATGLRHWYHTAKGNTKAGRSPASVTPYSSQPSSPLHLLHNFQQKSAAAAVAAADDDSYMMTTTYPPRVSDFDGGAVILHDDDTFNREMSFAMRTPPLAVAADDEHKVDIDVLGLPSQGR